MGTCERLNYPPQPKSIGFFTRMMDEFEKVSQVFASENLEMDYLLAKWEACILSEMHKTVPLEF